MKTVLVTGGSGFIGGALVKRFRDDGAVRVWAPSRTDLDLSKAIAAEIFPESIDVLVHCAASRDRYREGAHRWAEEASINLESTVRFYEWARRRRIPAIVHVSTISVLQPNVDPVVLLDEDTPLVAAPNEPYALTKRWSEELAISLRGGFEAIAIVRPGMTYGPKQHARGPCARMADAIHRRQKQVIAAPRGHRLAPVFIDDVVDVLARLVKEPKNLTVNVAGPNPLYEEEIFRDLGVCFGVPVEIAIDEGTKGVSFAPSTAIVDSLFAGRTRTSWREGLAKTWRTSGQTSTKA